MRDNFVKGSVFRRVADLINDIYYIIKIHILHCKEKNEMSLKLIYFYEMITFFIQSY